MPLGAHLAIQAAHALLTGEEKRRLEALSHGDARHRLAHGDDPFGLQVDWLAVGLVVTRGLYRYWFRVESRGIDRIPPSGPAILCANHGGMLPYDGMMLWADVVRRSSPPRIPRPVADLFVSLLPFVGTFFARAGVVSGTRGNVHRLLERGELLLIFPEGTPAIGKPLRERYRVLPFRVGHAEMAIRHRAPIVPVAIAGPDVQFPLAFRLPLHVFGAPWVPVSPIPIPLPVRYRIRYGEPILLSHRYRSADADDPEALVEASERVRRAEQALLDDARRGAP